MGRVVCPPDRDPRLGLVRLFFLSLLSLLSGAQFWVEHLEIARLFRPAGGRPSLGLTGLEFGVEFGVGVWG